MRIHILSDLHLEFAPFVPPSLDVDVVVLAGDIHVGERAIPWAIEHFPNVPVLYVLGNHEYYRNAMPLLLDNVRAIADRTNVKVLEDDVFYLRDVTFLGCTLWTDFYLFGDPIRAGAHAHQNMNDYELIRVSPSLRKLRAADTIDIHLKSRQWLREQFDVHRGKKVVVITHQAPSMRSVPIEYKDDPLTPAFASNLDALVESSGASLWIHGHMHRALDYNIGKTRVICNPRGYPGEPNTNFTSDLVVNV